MVSRIIESSEQLPPLFAMLGHRKLPMTVTVKTGKHRSHPQNHLQFKWMVEAAEQLQDEGSEDKRAYCKLHFAVPILRNEDAKFRAEYDEIIRPLPYEHKLRLMKEPFSFKVTSLMSTKQMTRYLDEVHNHFTSLGVILTQPEVHADA